MDTKILEEMGFSPKEIDVYMTVLSMEDSSVFEIMSKAKVSRQSIYEILEKLLDKGLISYIIKDRKKKYNVVNPQRLVELIKEKEAKLQSLLPELLKRYNRKKEDTKFEMFVGKEGMKTVTSKVLKEGKPLYVFANEGEIFDFLKYYMPHQIRKEEKIKLPVKVIFIESARKKKLSFSMTEVRYIPDNYSSPISISIYGDNVHILIFSKDNPLALYIKSKEISDSFMNYFNLMWKMAKE